MASRPAAADRTRGPASPSRPDVSASKRNEAVLADAVYLAHVIAVGAYGAKEDRHSPFDAEALEGVAVQAGPSLEPVQAHPVFLLPWLQAHISL